MKLNYIEIKIVKDGVEVTVKAVFDYSAQTITDTINSALLGHGLVELDQLGDNKC